MKIFIIAGARPNFMKISPIIEELKRHPDITYKLIHTGQHFDKNMSDTFFEDLSLPYPDIHLNIHGGSVSYQIGTVMIALDAKLQEERPDYVLVVGDVNATIASALTAKHNNIKLIHVEAGLRSFDMTMPEEINRITTDKLSDFLFVSEESGIINLKNEGITQGVSLIGNVMIDCLIQNMEKIEGSAIIKKLDLKNIPYGVVTIHRPSNVDHFSTLQKIVEYFLKLSQISKLVIPLHPRTRKSLISMDLIGLLENNINITLTDPLGYLDFIKLVKNSTFVLTDSGGIQEETTYLQIPCLTMRENTERPITVDIGSNTLVGSNFHLIDTHISDIFSGNYKKGKIPDLWDGTAAKRILSYIK